MSARRFMMFCFSISCSLMWLWTACTTQQQVPGNPILINHKFNSVQVQAHRTGQVTATCDAGQVIYSGGFATLAPDSDTVMSTVNYPLNTRFIYASYPSSTSAWTVKMLNRESSDILLTVHIYCSATPATQLASATGTTGNTPLVASCPGGTQLTGGGFQVTDITTLNDVVSILSSRATSNVSGWQVSAREARGSGRQSNTLAAYAVCTTAALKSVIGTAVTVKANGVAPAQVTIGQGAAGCVGNQLLLSAGFDVTNSDGDGNVAPVLFYSDYSQSSPQWTFSLASLPNAGIEGGAFNSGASGVLIPLCGN